MSARQSQAAGIAGLSLLACAAMVLMIGVMQAFRAYAPALREHILWCVEAPQFGIGMLFMAMLSSLMLVCVAWGFKQ